LKYLHFIDLCIEKRPRKLRERCILYAGAEIVHTAKSSIEAFLYPLPFRAQNGFRYFYLTNEKLAFNNLRLK
jgi:hypothetical protein